MIINCFYITSFIRKFFHFFVNRCSLIIDINQFSRN